jgi:ABC-type polysaccharide/polyol phosphate export permease
VALVRKRTIPTVQLLLVREVSAIIDFIILSISLVDVLLHFILRKGLWHILDKQYIGFLLSLVSSVSLCLILCIIFSAIDKKRSLKVSEEFS